MSSFPSFSQANNRFHGTTCDTDYLLPHDDEEIERLDSLQNLFRMILGKNIIAPLSIKPSHILDVGAGSGKWCIEVAEELPHALVVGIELYPIERSSAPPSNCQFLVADLNNGLQFDDGSLDVVHSR